MLRYGLKLGEREIFSFETADMGNLFHSALEKYFRKVREEKLDITAVEESKRKELVRTCVADAARELGGDSDSSASIIFISASGWLRNFSRFR